MQGCLLYHAGIPQATAAVPRRCSGMPTLQRSRAASSSATHAAAVLGGVGPSALAIGPPTDSFTLTLACTLECLCSLCTYLHPYTVYLIQIILARPPLRHGHLTRRPVPRLTTAKAASS